MAYAPIAAIIPQYDEQTGWFLKFYQPNTTTPIAMATDSEGGTLLAKCQLDNDGFPTTDGTQLFIPHMSTSYDAYLFPSAALADANDTTNAKRVAKDNRPLNSGASASNLKDYGAVGDGVTDDSDAIQEWANQGGILYAPRGVYRVTKEIVFREFTQMYGESSGVGSGGGDPTWSSLQAEAELGATIFYATPDQWNSGSNNIFKGFNDSATLNPVPSISFRDFKIQCPRTGAVPANMLNIVNGYDAVYLRNINLMFCHSDYSALAMTCIRDDFFPNVSQTGIAENVVAIGDDVYTDNGAPVAYIQAQQEMQFIGLKVIGAAQQATPRPKRTCIAVEDCRGLTFVGSSCGVCSDDNYGLDIYAVNRNVDGISVIGHTFEDLASGAGEDGTGDTGGAFQIDAVSRLASGVTATVSRVYITSTRIEFPTKVAGALRGAQQCTIDAATAYIYLTDNTGTCTINNLFQDKIIDNSGNGTNTVITPVNTATNSRTQNTGYAVQRDNANIDLLSKDLSEGYRFIAGVGASVDQGLTLRKLDGTILQTYLPNGVHQINAVGRGTQYRTPDDSKFYELRTENNGSLRMVNPTDVSDFNINNDIPVTSASVTFGAGSQCVGGTVRRDFTISNNVQLLEDSTTFPINGRFTVTQTNSGTTNIIVESGVTLNGVLNGSTSLIGYSAGLPVSAYVTKIDSNEYEVTGAINAVT